MVNLAQIYARAATALERQDWLLPTLARFAFAAVLAVYFFHSASTKVGEGLSGLWSPTAGAYVQILPKAFEAAGYDSTGLSPFHHAIVIAGTIAELALPVLIILGLFTRLAALATIGFILVQSLTDIYGHGQTSALGSWFDRLPDAAILDQRALWIFLLVTLLVKGGGPFSLDRALNGMQKRPVTT